MLRRSGVPAALTLGCTALLSFDPSSLPARAEPDATQVEAAVADAPPSEVLHAPCDPACAAGLVCERGACGCPTGTRDCGGGRGARCRPCCEDADCDDDNGCTADRCDPNGRCAHVGCEGARVCCDRARCCVGSCAGRCM